MNTRDRILRILSSTCEIGIEEIFQQLDIDLENCSVNLDDSANQYIQKCLDAMVTIEDLVKRAAIEITEARLHRAKSRVYVKFKAAQIAVTTKRERNEFETFAMWIEKFEDKRNGRLTRTIKVLAEFHVLFRRVEMRTKRNLGARYELQEITQKKRGERLQLLYIVLASALTAIFTSLVPLIIEDKQEVTTSQTNVFELNKYNRLCPHTQL